MGASENRANKRIPVTLFALFVWGCAFVVGVVLGSGFWGFCFCVWQYSYNIRKLSRLLEETLFLFEVPVCVIAVFPLVVSGVRSGGSGFGVRQGFVGAQRPLFRTGANRQQAISAALHAPSPIPLGRWLGGGRGLWS